MKNKGLHNMKNSHHVLHANLAPVCFTMMLALGMVLPVQAAVIADNSAANQPPVHTGANGVTIVDINKASADGVSHNIYSQFNVDQNGVVLNNSGAATNTQLAGQINGNANMAGGSAKVILNEVRSSDPSQLNGMVEVAGKSAQVIIANPSGITCDGCGFINTNHATLTTGTATIDGQGNVKGLDVKKGQVVITGKGMNTTSTQYTDIIARSVKVNAQLKANELNITTGSNHIDKNGRVTAIKGEGAAPQLALDVSSLGSMYANKIYMKGTEAGVGVRVDHADLTANDTLSIDANGVLENNGGRITGVNNVALIGSDVLNQNGQIVSSGLTAVSASNTFDNTQGKVAGRNVSVYGKTTLNSKGSIHGSSGAGVVADTLDNRNGNISSEGNLALSRATNNNYDYGGNGSGLDNRNGNISAKGDLSVDMANVNNSAGHVTSEGSLNVNTDTLINDHGVVSSGKADKDSWSYISTNTLNNDNGTILAKGADDMLNVNVNNTMTNHDGNLHSNGSLQIGGSNGTVNNASGSVSADKDMSVYANAYYSDAKSTLTAGHDANISVTQSFQNAGLINAGHDMSLNLDSPGWYGSSPSFNSGAITADGYLTVQKSSSEFNNSGSISANQMDWQMGSLTNNGDINSRNDINVYTNNLFNNGKINAENNANITASYLMTNAGSQIKANHDANVTVSNNLSNAGDIIAANNVNLATMSYGYPYMNAENLGIISAGNALNMKMDSVSFYNSGMMSADKSLTANARYINNDGVISSEGNVALNTSDGITNSASGNIIGNKVTTTGYVYNMGKITQTGTAQDDNSNTDTDTGDSTADNGNNNNTDIQPNGTPYPMANGAVGVWEDGVVYAPGDMYNGHVVQAVIFFPDSYVIKTAA